MNLIPLTKWADAQGIHRSRAHVLVNEKRIPGAVMLGNRWYVPANAKRLDSSAAVKKPKARIAQNIWGNWNGYIGTRKVREFGVRSDDAESWLADQ